MTLRTSFRPYSVALAPALLASTALADQFSVIALPDTQFYSRYRDNSQYLGFENPFVTQMNWIAANSASRNIAFTSHLGDVVDQVNQTAEWEYADQTMGILDANNINYGVARGNHDLSSNNGAPFTNYFGPQRFQNMPTYGGSDANGVNSFHIFQGGGREYMTLFIDWRMDAQELDWAKSVLDANSDIPTIIIGHDMIAANANDPSNPTPSAHGELIWNELIADNDQVFMSLNGHYHGIGHRVAENNFGNEVLQMVVDTQFSAFNGAGYLRELVFDTEANTITASTFSPWVMAAEAAGYVIPPFLNVPAEITTPQGQFVYSIDFEQRFANIPTPGTAAVLGLAALGASRRRRTA